MENKRVAIVVPTINCSDLLIESLYAYNKVLFNCPLVIIDNGWQFVTDTKEKYIEATSQFTEKTIIRNIKNIGVAASWNKGCQFAFSNNADACLVLNDDVYLNISFEVLQALLEIQDSGIWKCEDLYQWSSFLITRANYEKIGDFDERFFPAYFEDNDYAYRAKLSNVDILTTPALNPAIYLVSESGQRSPELLANYMKNSQYFEEKWGGKPGQEIFTTPFG